MISKHLDFLASFIINVKVRSPGHVCYSDSRGDDSTGVRSAKLLVVWFKISVCFVIYLNLVIYLPKMASFNDIDFAESNLSSYDFHDNLKCSESF